MHRVIFQEKLFNLIDKKMGDQLFYLKKNKIED